MHLWTPYRRELVDLAKAAAAVAEGAFREVRPLARVHLVGAHRVDHPVRVS